MFHLLPVNRKYQCQQQLYGDNHHVNGSISGPETYFFYHRQLHIFIITALIDYPVLDIKSDIKKCHQFILLNIS